ncbi:NAD(P)-dependent alcohol dehydrogenase [Rhodoferax mekongensis]|nr:NAD(P)-dependent alcohol dehydrogenase [Rhodoferax sp. TBRC 17307]
MSHFWGGYLHSTLTNLRCKADNAYDVSSVEGARLLYIQISSKFILRPRMTSSLTSSSLMKAWECTSYGAPSVLKLTERPIPQIGDDDVLVEMRATTVSSGDSRVRGLRMPNGFRWIARPVLGLFKPRCEVLGTDIAGNVVSVGVNVTKFRVGDKVLGFAGAKMGCHAAYRVFTPKMPLARMPEGLTYEEAVSIPFGATVAVHFIKDVELNPNAKVLVIGASGAVGLAFVQLCKHLRCHVTAVTSSPNHQLVYEQRADRAISYGPDYLRKLDELFDLIVDTVGAAPFGTYEPFLKPSGSCVSVSGGLADVLKAPMSKGKLISGPVPLSQPDLDYIVELTNSGVFRPVIDRIFGFDEMHEAHSRVDTGRKRGSVVIKSY